MSVFPPLTNPHPSGRTPDFLHTTFLKPFWHESISRIHASTVLIPSRAHINIQAAWFSGSVDPSTSFSCFHASRLDRRITLFRPREMAGNFGEPLTSPLISL